jgi:hypothetical protein
MRSMISAAILATVAIGCIGTAHAQFAGSAVRAAYVVEPFTPSTTVTIQGTGVRLRAEPFTQGTAILSHGSTGLPLTIVGIARLPDWNWYQVILKSGQKAFIRSDYTSAPSEGDASAASASAAGRAAPLPPPNRIDYGTSSPAVSPAPASAPMPLTPPQPAPVYPPAANYVPPAPTYVPPTPVYTPQPVPAQTAPPTSGGSAISLVPRSPMPSAPSDNSGGLTSVDPNVYPR